MRAIASWLVEGLSDHARLVVDLAPT